MLNELLFEKKRDYYYSMLSIDIPLFKRQRIQSIFLMIILWLVLAGVGFWYLGASTEVKLLLASLPLAGYMGWKYPYYKMIKMFDKRTELLSMMFPEFLTTFISLLGSQSGNNLIPILRVSAEYIKDPLRGQVLKLARDVEENPSVEVAYKAFMDFARFVGTREAMQVMSLLFEMYQSGINQDALAELERKIDLINENKLSDLVVRKNTRLRGMSIPSLVLATFFIFVWVGTVLVRVLADAMQGINL